MRQFLVVVLVLAACAGAVLLLARPAHVAAQGPQFELVCPAGTQPINAPGFQTYNSASGKVRIVGCVDATGRVTWQADSLAPGTSLAIPATVTGSLPAANVSGTLPASQVGTGYPFSSLAGNIAVSQMNGGTGAGAGTFWRGDGAWAAPPAAAASFLQAQAASFSPAASTTYFFGQRYGETPFTTTLESRMYIGRAGTLARADLWSLCSTNASAGNSTFAIRQNDTTDLISTTFSSASCTAGVLATATGSAALAAGDFLEVKIVTPAWATAPVGLRFQATLTIN